MLTEEEMLPVGETRRKMDADMKIIRKSFVQFIKDDAKRRGISDEKFECLLKVLDIFETKETSPNGRCDIHYRTFHLSSSCRARTRYLQPLPGISNRSLLVLSIHTVQLAHVNSNL